MLPLLAFVDSQRSLGIVGKFNTMNASIMEKWSLSK